MFKAHLVAQESALPGYVEREFDEYLKCGRVEHGFLRVRCETCHAEHLVAFSCKRRGFCPSCGARRMADECMARIVPTILLHFLHPWRSGAGGRATQEAKAEGAARVVDEVFPKQPVRQWVLSFPYPLRFLFASGAAITGQVLELPRARCSGRGRDSIVTPEVILTGCKRGAWPHLEACGCACRGPRILRPDPYRMDMSDGAPRVLRTSSERRIS